MASGWVKSLQCKSKAFDDVYNPVKNTNPKHVMSSYSCRRSSKSLKDVIETKKPKPKPKQKKLNPKPDKREADPVLTPSIRIRSSVVRDPALPTLTELPEGHQSRNVVEIIFQTSWGPKPFSGRVDMIFKVQNGSKTLTRFEEYREAVKARSVGKAREYNARSIADGNETMRFYSLGPSYVAGGSNAWGILGGKCGGAPIYTFAGSSTAHEKAGGGKGRKAMLVCRVIAGRVTKQNEFKYDSDIRTRVDSVSGDDGEMLVFDTRAVLPCFLIIYRL